MPIYRLTPTAAESQDWRASNYKGPALVRARSENMARYEATGHFWIAVALQPGSDILINPWNQSDLVRCELVKDSGYPEDGPDQLLEPADKARK